ncbi:MAG: helix-turn-helix domain-containing protein [Veillonella parvula]|uniref:helix-turn-helix domain-containing protein n=1 Tax=Veillonella parvula TaxID=29466 RepID=UPI003990E54C
MQNTSMVGVPINCINWLALGAVVYGAMEKKKALRVLGLKEQYKTNNLIKYAEVKALVNKGISYREIAEELGVSLSTFKNKCKELGITSKRGRKKQQTLMRWR